MMKDFIVLSPADNVGIALKNLEPGYELRDGSLMLRSGVPSGHKFALRDIGHEQNVIRYGSPIGHATRPILAGEHVHVHNTRTNLSGAISYAYKPKLKTLSVLGGKHSFK